MCGFSALFENKRVFDPELLKSIEMDLYHRGPDSGGIVSGSGYALIFRRLAIIDFDSSSDQPMTDSTGRYTIVFNGEIYNYQDLRYELQARGEVFRTKGDAEVILRGFMFWGKEIFSKLQGMFAVVIWDHWEEKCVAARDPLGIKPLYVAHKDGKISFSSEMRPLRRLVGSEPDTDAMKELLLYRFASGRLSNLRNIELVIGGSVISYDLKRSRYQETLFCDFLDTFQSEQSFDEREGLEQCQNALYKSIDDHLQSDSGYSVQLSGGVDSSLLTAIIKTKYPDRPLRTYGINLAQCKHDEAEFRKMVIARYQVEHQEVVLNGIDFADALPRAISHMEGPSAHYGCVMLMLLCDRIRETDKVVLTGEGADEFFGGYARYGEWKGLKTLGQKARLIPSFLWPLLNRYRGARRYAKHDPAIVSSIYFDFLKINELFPDLQLESSYRNKVAERFSDFRERMMAVDQATYLSSLLMRQDKMSMAASVEARVPFAHMPLVGIVNKIPIKLRVPGGETKPILKKIAEPWLPKKLLYRRKIGLTLPLDDWLRDPEKLGRYLDDLESPNSRLIQYADRKKITALVRDFRNGKQSSDTPPVMNLVNMELWLRSLESIDLAH